MQGTDYEIRRRCDGSQTEFIFQYGAGYKEGIYGGGIAAVYAEMNL